jgi:hypothetical protein
VSLTFGRRKRIASIRWRRQCLAALTLPSAVPRDRAVGASTPSKRPSGGERPSSGGSASQLPSSNRPSTANRPSKPSSRPETRPGSGAAERPSQLAHPGAAERRRAANPASAQRGRRRNFLAVAGGAAAGVR